MMFFLNYTLKQEKEVTNECHFHFYLYYASSFIKEIMSFSQSLKKTICNKNC